MYEKALDAARKNRVRVAVSTLRAAGLEALLQHDASGYLFDPSVDFVMHGDDDDDPTAATTKDR
jgi:hypothetical protein